MRTAQAIGKEGYAALASKTIVIIGVGGTGCTVANLLGRLPFKKIILIDRDIVESSNLERQILFTSADVGEMKADAAKKFLEHVKHSNTNIESNSDDLTFKTIENLIPKDTDLILECTDNTETRLLINEYAKKHSIPWIYSAGVGKMGSISLILPQGPCFACFNKHKYGKSCAQAGVLASTVSLVASFAVNLALGFLAEEKQDESLYHINLDSNDIRKLNRPKDPSCSVCKKEFSLLTGEGASTLAKLCGDGRYALSLRRELNLADVQKRVLESGEIIVRQTDNVLQTDNLILFRNGRILVNADNEIDAKKKVTDILGVF